MVSCQTGTWVLRTPLAVRMGLAFSLGTRARRYCGGTAAMMSTNRGCASSPYLAEVFVFTLKTEKKHKNKHHRRNIEVREHLLNHLYVYKAQRWQVYNQYTTSVSINIACNCNESLWCVVWLKQIPRSWMSTLMKTYLLRLMSLPSSWASTSCLMTSAMVIIISSARLRSPDKQP